MYGTSASDLMMSATLEGEEDKISQIDARGARSFGMASKR